MNVTLKLGGGWVKGWWR